MSWYSWQLQLSKSCRPLPLARTYAARPDSPFWRLRIALATKRRALARSAPSCDLRYSGEVFGRFRPALQHLFARFATIISGCGNWGRRRAPPAATRRIAQPSDKRKPGAPSDLIERADPPGHRKLSKGCQQEARRVLVPETVRLCSSR